MNLNELEKQIDAAQTPEDFASVRLHLAAIVGVLRRADTRAHRALSRATDLRPELRRYVQTYAEVSGLTAAEQVAAFAAEGKQPFCDLFLLAVGFDPCS